MSMYVRKPWILAALTDDDGSKVPAKPAVQIINWVPGRQQAADGQATVGIISDTKTWCVH